MGTIILADVTELETIKISELTEAASMDADDVTPIVKDGVTEKITRPNALQDAAVDFSQIQGPLIIPVKEENVGAIVTGQPLAITGVVGEMFKVGLADCDDPDKIRFLGLAFGAITQNNPGQVCFGGVVPSVDTTAGSAVNPNSEVWAAGQLLFVDVTAGCLTKTGPTSGRRIKAARSRRGNHAEDDLLVLGWENPVWMTAASGEDLVLRMGDNAGVNKVSFRDYVNNEVGSIDSDGLLTLLGATGITSNPESGQYRIVGLRLDADKKIVITYDETPIP